MRKLLALFMCGAVVGTVALTAGGCGSSSTPSPGTDSGTDGSTKDGSKTDGPVTGDGGGKDGSSEGGGDAGCLSFPEFVLNQIKTTKPDSPPVKIPPPCAADSGLIPSSSF
jgi:hypothetical protein